MVQLPENCTVLHSRHTLCTRSVVDEFLLNSIQIDTYISSSSTYGIVQNTVRVRYDCKYPRPAGDAAHLLLCTQIHGAYLLGLLIHSSVVTDDNLIISHRIWDLSVGINPS
jgi:hypothetical protein